MTSGLTNTEPEGCDDEICRLCLSEDSLEAISKEEGLRQWISDFLSITISTEDHMSQAICAMCRTRLIEFHEFRIHCREVQDILKAMAQNENDEIEEEAASSDSETENQPSVQDSQGILEGQTSSKFDQIELREVKTEPYEELDSIIEIYEHELGLKCEPIDSPSYAGEHQEEANEDSIGVYDDHVEIPSVDNSVAIAKTTDIIDVLANFGLNQDLLEYKSNSEDRSCVPLSETTARYPLHERSLKRGVEDKVEESPSLDELEKRYYGTKRYQCDVCFREFPNGAKLDRHNKIHRIRKFGCSVCMKLFGDRWSLRRHMLANEHQRFTAIPKIHKCHICGITFAIRSNLERHLDSHNPQELQQEVTNTASSEIEKGKLACHDWQQVCRSHYSLLHEKQLKCPLCDAAFEIKSHLVSHVLKTHKPKDSNIRRMHQPKILGCPVCHNHCLICNKFFPSKVQKTLHMQYRHVRVPMGFKCNVCAKKFRKCSYLMRHVKDFHSDDRETNKQRQERQEVTKDDLHTTTPTY